MEINYHHQDKYSPNKFHVYIEIDGKKIRDSNYLEIDYILRDISYVRHQCANYLFLYAGQFRFPQILTLPYWDFLFLSGQIHDDEIENIQDGCLLIISLFLVEVYDDDGSAFIYDNQLLDKIDNALNLFTPKTGRQKNAVEKIKFLRKYIDDDKVLRRTQPDKDSIEIEKKINEYNQWLYTEFIENYFWATAKSFEIERQRSADRMKQLLDKQ